MRTAILIVAMLPLLLTGCGVDGLDDAEAKWQANGFREYSYRTRGTGTEATDEREVVITAAIPAGAVGTIEWMFSRMSDDPGACEADFHSELGYPTEVWCEGWEDGAGYEVWDLEPL